MTVIVAVAATMLGLAILLGLVRIATATDGASRAVVGDLVFFSAIGLLLPLSLILDSAAILDAAMLAALLGILATIALSRILTRGRR